jgi:hypothetical protein
MPRSPLFSEDEVIASLRRCRGIMAESARDLNCSRKTIYNYCQKYPRVRECLLEQREYLLDQAEKNLCDFLDEKSWQATSFVLAKLGSKRGYAGHSRIDLSVTQKKLEEMTDDELWTILLETSQGKGLDDASYI